MDAGTSEGSGSVGTAGTYYGGTGTQVAAPGGHGTVFHILNERHASVEELVDWCTLDTRSAESYAMDRANEQATLLGLLVRQSAAVNTLPAGAAPEDPEFTVRVSLCLHIRHEL
jgi:CubicO group peptidase (beta-lactamase class C family)